MTSGSRRGPPALGFGYSWASKAIPGYGPRGATCFPWDERALAPPELGGELAVQGPQLARALQSGGGERALWADGG